MGSIPVTPAILVMLRIGGLIMSTSVAKFLLGVKQEALRVSWASKSEVMGFLFVLILIIAVMSVLFCCVDFFIFKID
ncbi:MAG: preprotein translocase subunit SecE [Ehrlichia sp.]